MRSPVRVTKHPIHRLVDEMPTGTTSSRVIRVVLLALLCASCTQEDRPESRQASGPRSGPMTLSAVETEAEIRSLVSNTSSSEASSAEARSQAGPAFTALRPPEAVMTDYLAETAEDGSANAPTIGRKNHAAFVSEARDISWADYVELHLREYLAGQRRGSFKIVGLECRSTMCEVLAVNGTPTGTSVDVDAWQDVIHAMKREPWYGSAQILEPEIEFGLSPDGRVAILTHLVRK